MKTLIKAEFKRNYKSLILWTAIIAGLAGLMLFLFPAFENSFEDMEEFIDIYPPEFLEAFGMGEGGLDMTEIYGWFGIEGYLFVTLIGGSYAAILGGSILSKEEDDKTVEFLLSKPISRTKVLFGKVIVVGINLFILNLVVSIVLLIAFSIFAKLNVAVWLLYSFAPLILQAIFASLSLLVSIFVTKSRKVLSIALGLVIGLYVVDLISKLTEEAEFLKYITPYEYVNAPTIVNDHMIKPLYLLLSVLIIGIAIVFTWRLYLKKDIKT
ncbi:MAG: ABC transporter permease [Candidatus Izimaplasma sp.]|nr:ABC transporter permease [Candidatus Izimaplasma bacterium]